MPLDSRYAFVFCVSSQMHWQHILAPKKYLIGSLAKSFQYTKSLTYKAPCNLWPKGSRPPSDGIFWHITARLWLLTNTDATPRKTRALFCVLGQPQFGGHNEANEFRREIRSWSCPPMSCNVTSSRISSAHNTKQNKCPLLIKPHNKCRPFVFPFILSTQGEHRNEDFLDSHEDKKRQLYPLSRTLLLPPLSACLSGMGKGGVVSLWLPLLCYLQRIYT